MKTEKKIIFRAPVGLVPHPYPLVLAVNKSPVFFFFSSRALDGLEEMLEGL